MTRNPKSNSADGTSASAATSRGDESAASRRIRSASIALLGFVVVLVCVFLANAVARKFSLRLDVTATGEHRLAPSTQSLLDSLQAEYHVALGGDFSTIDKAQMERARDVLGQMHRANERVDVRFLDTSSPAGQSEFQDLIRQLAERDRDLLELQTRSIRAAADRGLTTAEYLETGLAPAIASIRDAIPPEPATIKLRESLDARSAACRLSAADLRAVAKSIDEPLSSKVGDVSIPQTDVAAKAVNQVLGSVAEQVSTLAKDLKAIGSAQGLPEQARNAATGLVAPAEKARDAALAAADTMSHVTRPDVLRVAKALSSGSACVVVGPPGAGLMAIELSQFFPPAQRSESAADAGRRAEQLVATAISSLNTPLRPIVVLMHGEQGTGLVAQKGIVTRVIERLALRGIDVVEWPVISQPQPPALTTLNPDGKRPVVYATIPPDSSAPKPKPTDPTGADRAAKFGAALNSVADSGAAILLSMYPSVLPSFGDKDPTIAVLERFGLEADTGRPLLVERLTPQGRIVETDQALRVAGDDHLLQKAVRGLPTLFLWPIAISAGGPKESADTGVTRTPLYATPQDSGTWAESQWLNYWRLPRNERAVTPNAPRFDEGRDARTPAFQVAWAAERPAAAGHPRQRLIAVGSNRWFMDPITTPMITIDGRTLAANPGNVEFFEACIYWLAGQDELIAQTPEARAVALVGNPSSTLLTTIRIAAVGAIPLLVLLIGVLYRVLRG